MDKLITVREAAHSLKVSESTVYRLCASGLPHIKKSFGLRFREIDLEKWLEEDKRKTVLVDNILRNALTNLPPLVIDKTKGGKEVARATKSRRNYGYGAVYIRKTMKGNPRYYIDYRNRNGERTQRLIKNALSWQEANEALKNAVLKEHYKECGIKEQKQPIKFKDFAQIYLKNYCMVKKRAWEKSDKVYLNANLIPTFGNFELTKIDTLLIERFIAKRLEKGVKKSTINRDISCLKKMLNKAIDWDYLRENPLAQIKRFPEKDNMRARVLSGKEEDMLLEESAKHLKPIILTALNTGMRLSEILNLQWTQIDFRAGRIRVEKTKSGKMRFIPINDVLHEEFLKLRNRNSQNPYVFFNPKTGKPLTTIKTAFNAACRRAKIKGLWFHDLRHTFGSRLEERRVDIETIRDLMGHYSITVTQRYTHTNEYRKRDAVEMLSRIPEERAKNGGNLLHIRYMSKKGQKTKEATNLFSFN